jgi:hypothetical protein
MAKTRKRLQQPTTTDGSTTLAPGAEATGQSRKETGSSVEDAALDFAEDLGRLLGTTQKKAEQWLGQRQALTERLTQIRDAASGYLEQLTGVGKSASRRPLGATRAGGRARGIDVGGLAPEPAGGKRKRKGMSPAQRKAVGERMKKYWAARRKAQSK